jgi:hypothetical protein
MRAIFGSLLFDASFLNVFFEKLSPRVTSYLKKFILQKSAPANCSLKCPPPPTPPLTHDILTLLGFQGTRILDAKGLAAISLWGLSRFFFKPDQACRDDSIVSVLEFKREQKLPDRRTINGLNLSMTKQRE